MGPEKAGPGSTTRQGSVPDRPYSGGLSPPYRQPVEPAFIGSSAIVSNTCSHFRHSKVRRSEWFAPGSIRALSTDAIGFPKCKDRRGDQQAGWR